VVHGRSYLTQLKPISNIPSPLQSIPSEARQPALSQKRPDASPEWTDWYSTLL